MASKKEDWMQSKWRPAMGWLYMATCAFDFIIFPVLWSLLQAFMKHPVTQWNPLTLQGAGLYHLAMGAVLGVAAWSRGQEKMASMNHGGSPNGSPPSGGFGGSGFSGGGFGSSPSSGGWGSSNSGGFGQTNQNSSWGSSNSGGFGQTNQNSSWVNRPAAPTPTYNAPMPEPLPPPPVKPGVRLSDNPTARVVLPEDPNDDADSKIK